MTRDLDIARLYFFIWIGALGFSFPFANLFFRQNGLSGAEIGLMLTVGSVAGLIASPLWGRWSDSGASLTRLLQLAFVVTAAGVFAQSQQTLFIWFALTNVWRGFAGAGISPLSDTLALRVSDARRAGYGSIRVWGSAGWAVSVLVSGWVIERTSLITSFYGNAIGYVGAALLLFLIPQTLHAAPTERAREHVGLVNAARELLKNPALRGLAAALIVRGMLADGHLQFGNIYLEQLGASTTIIGIASMLAAVVELPGFFAADYVVKKIGARRTLLFSFLITGGKFVLVLAFPAVWSVLVTRAVEGIAFSMFTIGLLRYILERAPQPHMATMLAFFTVTLTALIQILGAPIGGIVFDVVGAYWLFALALGGNFLACLLFLWFARKQT